MATETDTQLVLAAIKEQSGRTEKVIGDLASEIRDLSSAIAKGFSTQRSITPNGRSQIVAMAAIVFGLMSPMYFVIQSVTESVSKHAIARAHPQAAAELSAYKEKLIEIETQFDNVESVALLHNEQSGARIKTLEVWKDNWVPRVRSLDSIQSERIRLLMKRVFGDDVATRHQD